MAEAIVYKPLMAYLDRRSQAFGGRGKCLQACGSIRWSSCTNRWWHTWIVVYKHLAASLDCRLQAFGGRGYRSETFGGIRGSPFTSLWWHTKIVVHKPLVANVDRRSQPFSGRRITLLILVNKRLFPTTQRRLELSILKSLAAFNYLESQQKQCRHNTTTSLTNIKQSESTAVSLMDRILFCPCYIFIWSNTHLPKTICLHADNCCRQNKNKTVIAYLAWRVIVGLNEEIELSFMRVGHTRCFVDGGFGLLKQRYRKRDELRRDLRRHQIDVCTLQETKLSSDLDTEEGGYRFICPAPER